jgi:hypothetical protein
MTSLLNTSFSIVFTERRELRRPAQNRQLDTQQKIPSRESERARFLHRSIRGRARNSCHSCMLILCTALRLACEINCSTEEKKIKYLYTGHSFIIIHVLPLTLMEQLECFLLSRSLTNSRGIHKYKA